MPTVGTLGFIVFIAILSGLWHFTPPSHRWQLMLAASLVFYLSLDWQGCLLLCLMTLLVWQAALRLRAGPGWFYAGLAAALAPLVLLKLRPAALALGLRIWDVSVLQVLGIGYFSLQLVSYLVDVRRGTVEPEPRFARLLCFASFFLSLTQGPFNRYGELMPQLDAPQPAQWQRGAQRCFWGYFKKLAVADRAALAVNAAFANPAAYDRSQLLLCAVLYSFQLYADFSGYTDIVLGAGEMLGLALPENFRQPFLAATIRELWDRWHISLSRWLKDYVYIPLGGSRCSPARRDGNIVATFLISGLWHGAGLTYLLWGLAHGVLQALENHLPWRKAITRGRARLVGIAGTFTLVVATFSLFRASSLANAAAYFNGILHNPGHKAFSNYWELGLTSRQEQLLLFFGLALVIAVDLAHERGIHLRARLAAAPRPLRWAVYEGSLFLFLFMAYFLGSGGFLYAVY